MFGEVSDGAKENLKSKAMDAVEHGKTVASEIYDHAAKAASASQDTFMSHMGDDPEAGDGKLGSPALDRGGAA